MPAMPWVSWILMFLSFFRRIDRAAAGYDSETERERQGEPKFRAPDELIHTIPYLFSGRSSPERNDI